MNIWKTLSQICVFLLILIAAIVATCIYIYGKAWGWIIVYWVILTIKNLFDFFAIHWK